MPWRPPEDLSTVLWSVFAAALVSTRGTSLYGPRLVEVTLDGIDGAIRGLVSSSLLFLKEIPQNKVGSCWHILRTVVAHLLSFAPC